MFFATTEKFSICLESLHFPMFSAKAGNAKWRREIVMENMWDSNVTLGSSTVPEDNQEEPEHTSLNGLQGYAFH